MSVAISIGRRGHVTLVSPEDEHLLRAKRWFAVECDKKLYVMRSERRAGRNHTFYLHRVILDLRPGQIADHINGDGLDNRRENLRIADASLNNFNRRNYKPSSGYRGVYQTGRRWKAMISARGRTIQGGRFETKEEAARRYDELAREHFGDFAVLNFPSAGGY